MLLLVNVVNMILNGVPCIVPGNTTFWNLVVLVFLWRTHTGVCSLGHGGYEPIERIITSHRFHFCEHSVLSERPKDVPHSASQPKFAPSPSPAFRDLAPPLIHTDYFLLIGFGLLPSNPALALNLLGVFFPPESLSFLTFLMPSRLSFRSCILALMFLSLCTSLSFRSCASREIFPRKYQKSNQIKAQQD